jgi:MFS transporter, DHA2 family, multidrug resistance protein
LTNIARNIGGSIGTSLLGTLLAREAQIHQVYLVTNITGSGWAYQSAIAQTRDYLVHHGFSLPQANAAAAAQLYSQLGVQANLLAYMDIIRLFAYFSLAVVPFCFVVKRPQPGQALVL